MRKLYTVFCWVIAGLLTMSCGRATMLTSGAFQEVFHGAHMAVRGLDQFKICVDRVRLEAENPSENPKEGSLQFSPGLIDLSSGLERDWGAIVIPEPVLVKRLKVKVKKNQALCGVDYSVLFNGTSTPRDIEFRWAFDPPVIVNLDTAVLRLSFTEIIDSIHQSALTNELQLKERIEAVEASVEAE